MTDDAGYPSVPESRLADEGWVRTEATEERVFALPMVDVVAHTVVYEDAALRERVRDATDGALDRTWRFCFASALTFRPPLPSGVGPAMVAPTVQSEAFRAFADRLRERGCREVTRTRRERLRVDTGQRARCRGYAATLPVETPEGRVDLAVEGWTAVWRADGAFRVAGGAYPTDSFGETLGVDVGPDRAAFRGDLFAFVRGVG